MSLGAVSALANPAGSSVAAGSAVVAGEGSANVTVNQATDKAIINWRSFDVGNGEATTFVQPGADSVTLNRVTGGLGTSKIDGSLKANGKVFLVNPDGILFGPQSIVDVGGLVATTHDIANDDFMAGRYVFGQPGKADASIVNAGTITAATGGFAALVAPGVRNAGTISARLGTVGLAAANRFTLDFYGDDLIKLAVGDEIAAGVKDAATGQPLDALVKNEGLIKADGGVVQLSAAAARQVVDSVINNKGVIEANSVGVKNGRIVLSAATAATKPAGAPTQKVKVAGKLTAAGKNPGETGGKVQITGEDIALTAATIDASGSTGGGTVLIGGDVGGGRPNPNVVPLDQVSLEGKAVPIATKVSVDARSTLDASATDAVNGGKVVAWANTSTDFAGLVRARGGARGGNGGFVEVSAADRLNFVGMMTDIAAPWGLAGTLLLDPYTAAPITAANVSTITSTLNAGGTAIVYGGSVSVQTNIFKTAGGTATLKIFGDDGITINSGVTIGSSTGKLNILLDADADFNTGGPGSGLGSAPHQADTQYPGSVISEISQLANGYYIGYLSPQFLAYLQTGSGSALSALMASGQGLELLPLWRQYTSNGVNEAEQSILLIANNVKFYTNGGTFKAYESLYQISTDARTLTPYSTSLQPTIATFVQSTVLSLASIYDGGAVFGGCNLAACYIFTSGVNLNRIQRSAPSGLSFGSMASSKPTSKQAESGQAKSNIVSSSSSTTVTVGRSTFVAKYANFPNFRQTDPSNTALYSSYAWAVTIDPTTGLPRYQETCLAVVYAMIEQSRGKTNYRVGNPGTWTDKEGAGGISGVSGELAVNYDSIKKNIDSGSPVVLHASDYKAGHFVLAIGYDSSGNIIANDPWTGNQVSISSATWKESGGGAGAAYTFNGGMRLVTL